MFRIRWMDVMMKILLPAGFIALKLTGTFIDFMLGLAKSNNSDDTEITTAQVRVSRLYSLREVFISWNLRPEVQDLFNLYENSTVEDSTISKGTKSLKNLLGNKTVEMFGSRTCVKPKILKNQLGETEIIYESLTAQDKL